MKSIRMDMEESENKILTALFDRITVEISFIRHMAIDRLDYDEIAAALEELEEALA